MWRTPVDFPWCSLQTGRCRKTPSQSTCPGQAQPSRGNSVETQARTGPLRYCMISTCQDRKLPRVGTVSIALLTKLWRRLFEVGRFNVLRFVSTESLRNKMLRPRSSCIWTRKILVMRGLGDRGPQAATGHPAATSCFPPPPESSGSSSGTVALLRKQFVHTQPELRDQRAVLLLQ